MIKDHLENEHESISAMCRAYNLPRAVYDGRRRRGWTMEQILTTPVKLKAPRQNVTDHKGNVYGSETEMCRHYGISRCTYRSRLEMGWTQEEALESKPGKRFETLSKPIIYNNKEYWSYTAIGEKIGIHDGKVKQCIEKGATIEEIIKWTKAGLRLIQIVTDHLGNRYPSAKALCDHYQISEYIYHSGISQGLSFEEILHKAKENAYVTDHLGNKYKNDGEMCAHYGIKVATYKDRLRKGWSQEDALTVPLGWHTSDICLRTDLDGIVHPSLKSISTKYNVGINTYKKRMKDGWSKEDALLTSSYISTQEYPVNLVMDGNKYRSLRHLCQKLKLTPNHIRKMQAAGFTNEEIRDLGQGVDVNKVIRDPDGNVYRSEKAMCKAHGIYQSTYRRLIEKGMTPKQAFTYKNKLVDPYGVEHDSFNALLRYYDISISVGHSRKRMGWTLKEIIDGKKDLEIIATVDGKDYTSVSSLCIDTEISTTALKTRLDKGMSYQEAVDDYRRKNSKRVIDPWGNEFETEAKMCRFHKIGFSTYKYRIEQGMSQEEALTNIPDKIIKDHLGNIYQTLGEMCKHYNISLNTFYKRKKSGWTLEEILTTPARPRSVDHSGEEKTMNCGLKLRLTKRIKNGVYDGAFEDGAEVKNIGYPAFSCQTARHPQLGRRSLYAGFKTGKRLIYNNNGDITTWYDCTCSKCGLNGVYTPQQMLEHSKLALEHRIYAYYMYTTQNRAKTDRKSCKNH